MKKIMSVILVVVALFTTTVPAMATGTPSNHMAQVHHAEGVNEFGSNIQACSELHENVPATFSQADGSISIQMALDDIPITITGTVRGRNVSDNVLYFDASCNDANFEVMTMEYNKDYASAAALYQGASGDNLFKVYLKKDNSVMREYYFVEFFDFTLNEFEDIMSVAPHCAPTFWNMKEFKSVNTEIEQSPIMTIADGIVEDYTITDSYYNLNVLQYAVMVVEKADDMTNIPVGGSEFWMHTLTVKDKYTLCPSLPDFDVDTSYLSIESADFQANSPIGAAYLWTEIDGQTRNPLNPFDLLSADVSVGYGPLSVSVNLSDIITHKGTLDLNETFDGYVNNESNDELTRKIKIDFDDNHPISEIGDYYQVLSCVRDYGDAQSDYSTIYTRWGVDLHNYGDHTDSNSSMIDSFSFRVGR